MAKKCGTGIFASAGSNLKRRDFLKYSASIAGGLAATGLRGSLLSDIKKPVAFKISLAEWSLHRALRSKEIDHLDFHSIAKIGPVRTSNVMFLEPVFTIMMGIALLHNVLGLTQWLGILVIILATSSLEFWGKKYS